MSNRPESNSAFRCRRSDRPESAFANNCSDCFRPEILIATVCNQIFRWDTGIATDFKELLTGILFINTDRFCELCQVNRERLPEFDKTLVACFSCFFGGRSFLVFAV